MQRLVGLARLRGPVDHLARGLQLVGQLGEAPGLRRPIVADELDRSRRRGGRAAASPASCSSPGRGSPKDEVAVESEPGAGRRRADASSWTGRPIHRRRRWRRAATALASTNSSMRGLVPTERSAGQVVALDVEAAARRAPQSAGAAARTVSRATPRSTRGSRARAALTAARAAAVVASVVLTGAPAGRAATRPTTTTENTVSSTETTAITGLASERTKSHSSRGSVTARVPLTNRAISSSSNEVRKANSAPARIPGRTSGIVTVQRVRVRFAPRLIAAHSSRSSKFFSVAATITVTYGIASTECARARSRATNRACAAARRTGTARPRAR